MRDRTMAMRLLSGDQAGRDSSPEKLVTRTTLEPAGRSCVEGNGVQSCVGGSTVTEPDMPTPPGAPWIAQ